MFSFRAWGPASHIGQATEIAASFQDIYSRLYPGGQPSADLSFEIVDLRAGPHAPDVVEDLIQKLAKLLLADAGLCHAVAGGTRLLFVGGVRTLASREKEGEGCRAIKQDAEFYIRALQNYGAAHYAYIGRGQQDASELTALVQSALIGMARHYDEPRPSPNPVRFADRLTQISGDYAKLLQSARKSPEFRYLGSADGPSFDGTRTDPLGLLREIGLIYQFGKGDRPSDFNPAKVLADLQEQNRLTFDVRIEHSSYQLFASILENMGRWAEAFHADAVTSEKGLHSDRLNIADEIAKRSFKLARYDLLRDFGRVLGQGTLQRFREIQTARPLLLIDDELHAVLEKAHVSERPQDHIVRLLQLALSNVDSAISAVHVVPSAFVDAHLGLMQADGQSRLIASDCRAYDLDSRLVKPRAELDQYIAILIDPESRRDTCGPVRVQRLHAYLQHRFSEPTGGLHAGRRLMPPLLAFSRKESSGYVQQCLNMGASAFVPKSRPYQMLFGLSRALRDERRQRRPDGQASQFRILKTLKPHVAAKLLRKKGPSYIYGALTLPPDPKSQHERHVADTREAQWIDALPKADLHYHFGTAIPCETVGVLAMNTAGHFLAAAPASPCRDQHKGKDNDDSGADPLLRRLASTLALTLRLERMFLPHASTVRFSRMELLAAAAAAVQPRASLDNQVFGLGDAVIKHLLDPNDRCDDAHATALLVAMMVSRPDFSLPASLREYFGALAEAAAREASRGKEPPSTLEPFTAGGALALETMRAHEHFHRLACRWNGSCTLDDFETLARETPVSFWPKLREKVEDRITAANKCLSAHLNHAIGEIETDTYAWERALAWVEKHNPLLRQAARREPEEPLPQGFSLADYAAVPAVKSGRGLPLYLRGADLLGSSHLQYPENLWIAALAITTDNASQNIIYSELRCETTGYAKAGMGAHDATEILRHGFNLASLYTASRPRPDDPRRNLPLVRTNILLAAKRHKTEPEARAVVQLLETYLERRAPVADSSRSRRLYFERFGQTMPPWWRPSDVVGFDLSGDEARDKAWLKTVITPLAARSSPVTIHAGEAASAESIWRAVYELNALRIGHGLRLTEDTALLSYCVREGICMELCPNSNRYTNQLDPQPRRDLTDQVHLSPLRYEYPLRHYLAQGMEVSLGTDNRYLHPPGQNTLTSEYLTAAELVGGLTRWEVLQIVKAGFKNAFLDKSEVRALIESVEEEIYRIVATEFA